MTIVLRQPLNFRQKAGLKLDTTFHNRRDVTDAIDLTESVGLNDEDCICLEQIIKNILHQNPI
ncbi:MAG: hypothetical protein ACRC2R_12840 [Xenococcaceae cyanobacterium]